tara:strand:- start:1142 stop:1333 length:192 start_codon:yes stop_codon:yes gene_type:complete
MARQKFIKVKHRASGKVRAIGELEYLNFIDKADYDVLSDNSAPKADEEKPASKPPKKRKRRKK